MSERFRQLSKRHAQLRAECAAQRFELGISAGEIERELGRIDRGIAIVRRVVASPIVIVGSIAAIALLGPRRLVGWASRGLMLFAAGRRLTSSLFASTAQRRDDG